MLLACGLALLLGGGAPQVRAAEKAPVEAPLDRSKLEPLPLQPGLENLDPPVQEQYRARRRAVDGLLADPGASAESLGGAYGQLGMWAQVYHFTEIAPIAYRNAERVTPGDSRWPYYLGHVYSSRGLIDPARAAFLRSLELSPEDVPTRVWLAELEFEAGRIEEAVALLGAALKRDPECLQARILMGRIAVQRGGYDEAVGYLKPVAEARPDLATVHYPLAMAYRGLGELELAKAQLRAPETAASPRSRPLMRDPLMGQLEAQNVGAEKYARAALSAARAGDPARAVGLYRKALDVAPGSALLRSNLATVLARTGRTEEAIEEYEAVLRDDPRNVVVHYSLAEVLEYLGRVRDAERHYRAALAADPKSATASFRLGVLEVSQGHDVSGMSHVERAIELDPRHSEYRSYRAVARLRAERRADAVAALREDLRILPDSQRLSLLLARILAASPELEEGGAEESLELARRLVSERATLLTVETMAMSQAAVGDFESAVAWQRAALAAAEKSERSDVMGWVRRRLELYEKGETCDDPWIDGEEIARRIRVESSPELGPRSS